VEEVILGLGGQGYYCTSCEVRGLGVSMREEEEERGRGRWVVVVVVVVK